MTSTTLKPITQFPSYFFHQIDSHQNTFKYLSDLETDLPFLKVFFNINSGGLKKTDFKFKKIEEIPKIKYKDNADLDEEFTNCYIIATLPKLKAASCRFYAQVSAINYIEKEVLTSDIQKFQPNQWWDVIKKINCLVTRSSGNLRWPMGYFIVNGDVIPTSSEKGFDELNHYVKQKFSEEGLKQWNEGTSEKIRKMLFASPGMWQEFSDKEKQLVKEFIFIPTRNILGAYSNFLHRIVKKINKAKNIDRLSAWIHSAFVEIQPFKYGNGRTARLIVNIVRMHFGVTPLLIDKEAAYIGAVRKGELAFAIYLKELAQKQQIKLDPFIDDFLRYVFNLYLGAYEEDIDKIKLECKESLESKKS